MKKQLKKLLGIVAMGALLGVFTFAAADSDKKYTFKIAHIAPEGHIDNIVARNFGKELDARSEGRMKLRIYPGGQLGNDADMLQQLRTGALEFALITNAEMTTENEAFSAWFAPFVFDSFMEAFEANESEIVKKISATVEGTGVRVLGYHFPGFRMIMTANKKLEKPEDFKGMTLRDTPSPALQDWNKLLGINTESLPLPEVYQAAQTGVIDGMVIDLVAAEKSKFDEVTNYAILTNHVVWPIDAMINEKLYETLSDGDRQIVVDSMSAAQKNAMEERSNQEEEFIQYFVDRGVEVSTIDKALFAPYIEQYDDEYSKKSEYFKEFLETFRN